MLPDGCVQVKKTRACISDILFTVPTLTLPRFHALAVVAGTLLAFAALPGRSFPQDAPSAGASPQQAEPPQAPAPAAPAAGPVIVLDPAHGGTDTGARGENGVVEKDLVLQVARVVRAELARQNFRVVVTRDDDSNPSYDARAAVANARRDAIFISFHIASTGTANTARAYYDQFWTPVSAPADAGAKPPNPPVNSLTPWQEAQRPYTDASHRLAGFIQIQLAQLLAGSPAASTGGAIRELRSVAAPAVAVELSSISATTPDALRNAAGPLATAIARAVTIYRVSSMAGAK